MRTHWMLGAGLFLVLSGVVGCNSKVDTKDLGTLIYTMPEIPKSLTPYVLPGAPPPADPSAEMTIPQETLALP